jgi:hypothetical protein
LTEFHLILKEVGARRKNRSAKVIFFFAWVEVSLIGSISINISNGRK